MRLEVLHVAECPHVSPLLRRLQLVTDLPVTTHQVDSEGDANERGMHGSPTLLIDGRDPFATADPAAGLSCRLFRDELGRPTSTPSIYQLRQAVRGR